LLCENPDTEATKTQNKTTKILFIFKILQIKKKEILKNKGQAKETFCCVRKTAEQINRLSGILTVTQRHEKGCRKTTILKVVILLGSL
jgi:hypothetical protein